MDRKQQKKSARDQIITKCELLTEVVPHANGLEIPTVQTEQVEVIVQNTLKVLPGVGREEMESSLFIPRYIFSYSQLPSSFIRIYHKKPSGYTEGLEVPVSKPIIDKSRCAHSTSATRPPRGSLAGKGTANDCGVRGRALHNVLIHESELSASRREQPDSERTQEQPGSITVSLDVLTF